MEAVKPEVHAGSNGEKLMNHAISHASVWSAFVNIRMLVSVAVSTLGSNTKANFDRGNSFTYFYITGGLFLVSSLVFWIATQVTEIREKRAVAFTMAAITAIVGITFTVLIPNGWTTTFRDVNGNAVDFANHWEQFINSTLLIWIMGEVTQEYEMALSAVKWNYAVIGCGFLGAITRDPFSSFSLWIAVCSYAFWYAKVDAMFTNAIEGKTNSMVSKKALWWAKIITFVGNHAVTTAFFLSRFRVLPFDITEFLCVFSQWIAKGMFGTILLIGYSK